MRIISGLYKGQNLKGHDLKGTRPTMDRVKESLFAMIQDYVQESICLDLFAGSGNLGLEALSQGAATCLFVDKNGEAIKVIQDNIKQLRVEEKATVRKDSFSSFLIKWTTPFSLIFLDPPYQTTYLEEALTLIVKRDLLAADGIIVLESDDKSKFTYDTTYFTCLKERKYGDKWVQIIKRT